MSKENKKNQIVIKKTNQNQQLCIYEETISMYKDKIKIGEITIQLKNKMQFYKEITQIEETIKDETSKERIKNLKKEYSEKINYIVNIEKLYVDTRFQKKGYRTKLMNLAIERYQTKNLENCILSLTRQQIGDVKSESLRKIYEKFGFKNNIKINNKENGILMYNNIEKIYKKEKRITKEQTINLDLNS